MADSIMEKADAVTGDDMVLMSMGKVSEMERVFNVWTLIAYQVMYMCSWSCFIVLYSTIFDLGGSVGLLYGTLVVAVGQTLLMMSVAEYCSIWPVAGGQQYYVQAVATPKWRPLMSYIVGWAVIIAEISTGASCALNSAQLIGAFIEYTHPDILWHPWMTYLIYAGFLLGPFAINLKHSWLPGLNLVGAAWTVVGGLAWAIVFCVMAEPRADAKFIFTEWINNSGYTNNFWVFIMSTYNPMYALYGTDGILHLVEETKDAAKTAPRAIVWSMIFCAATSWLSCLVLLWTSSNWETYMEGTQPYLDWFIDVTQSTYGGGVFCVLLMAGLNFFCIVATNTAGSRLVWSMARDNGFPFAKYFDYTDTRFGIPLRSMAAIFVVELLICLILLGSDLAFQSIIAAGGATLQIGYAAPILIVLIRGRKILPARAHFDLGRWGYLVNYISVTWAIFTIVMFLCPLYVPVTITTIDNMNWSILIVGVTILLPGLYWIFRGRLVYAREHNTVLEDPAAPPGALNGIALTRTESASDGNTPKLEWARK